VVSDWHYRRKDLQVLYKPSLLIQHIHTSNKWKV